MEGPDIVTTLDHSALAHLPAETPEQLRAIHEEAFPLEERQYSMDYMLGRLGRPDSILRVIRSGRQVAGYMYLEFRADPATVFLWYMAIRPDLRDQGLGRSALTDTLETLRRDHPALRFAFFEVHRPLEAEDPAKRTLDLRRIGLYRRLGAYWVRGVDYRIPAADDPNRSVAYDPMFFALRDGFADAEIRERVLLMASDNFDKALDDPRWLSLRDSLPGMVVVSPSENV